MLIACALACVAAQLAVAGGADRGAACLGAAVAAVAAILVLRVSEAAGPGVPPPRAVIIRPLVAMLLALVCALAATRSVPLPSGRCHVLQRFDHDGRIAADDWHATVQSVGAPRGGGVAVDGTPRPSARAYVVALRGADRAGDPVCGRVRLSVRYSTRPLLPGDRIVFRSALRTPVNYGNPGEFDWAGYNARRGVFAMAFVWDDAQIERRGPEAGAGWRMRARRSAAERALRDGDAGGLVAALGVGTRGWLSEPSRDAMRDAGLAHALAISGLHMALAGGAAFFGIRRASVYSRFCRAGGDVVPVAALGAAGLIALYAALAGFAASIVRASACGFAALAAVAAGRRGGGLTVLAVPALGLSVAVPGIAAEAGFQLSFAACAALMVRAPSRGETDGIARRLGQWVRFCVWIWAVTAAPAAFHFHRVSLVAPMVNAAAAPLIAVLVAASLGASLEGLLVDGGGPAYAAALLAAEWLLAVAGLASSAGSAAATPALDVVSPGAAAALCATLAVAAAGSEHPRRYAIAAFAAMLAAGAMVGLVRERYRDDRLAVTFLSVGQGDATLVQLPGGAVMLVDAGRPGRGRLAVRPQLARSAIRRIDFLVVTHAQSDHWGGAEEIAEYAEVGTLLHNGGACDAESYSRMLAQARARGTKVVDASGETSFVWRTGGVHRARIRVFQAGLPGGSKSDCRSNDRSLVVEIAYRGRRIVLPGDIEARAERRLVADRRLAPAFVLKAPHHGSATSSTGPLLDAVSPRAVVFSRGLGNRYGFPAEDVARRYAERGIAVFDTAVDGAVRLVVDARGARMDRATAF